MPGEVLEPAAGLAAQLLEQGDVVDVQLLREEPRDLGGPVLGQLRVRDEQGQLVMRATIDALWRRRARGETASDGAGPERELSPVDGEEVLI